MAAGGGALLPAAEAPFPLTGDQSAALARISGAAGAFHTFLLHGVTGSGKTEVYLQAIALARASGKGALVLVPEIALTPQLAGRFRARFGDQVALLHSGLSDRERHGEWLRLRRGEARICVGVRSAVFAPVQDLGIVVVDEEHDPSFKQDDGPGYHARDLAVVRAREEGSVCVLGSATPSLETLENARTGKYERIELPRRIDDRPLPEVRIVDLSRIRKGAPLPGLLSPALQEALAATVRAGRQAILFLNRRGFQTLVLCRDCGREERCANCSVSLTLHARRGVLLCHYCGATERMSPRCPSCGGERAGVGAGTEQVEAAVREIVPSARVARIDRDALSGAGDVAELLARFARREIDVLVGTQMVTKGHDFPGVTLVGVVLADTALALPDFRAAERTFQLLTQVAGRAGRGDDPGQVLVQTFHPHSPAVAFAVGHDYAGFAEVELDRRRALGYPPFGRMMAVRVEGSESGARRTAEALGEAARPALVRGRVHARSSPGRHRAHPREEPLAPALPRLRPGLPAPGAPGARAGRASPSGGRLGAVRRGPARHAVNARPGARTGRADYHARAPWSIDMVREILIWPDPILKQKALPVDAVDDGVRRLLDDMSETMYAADGVGLAAPQIGVLKRCIVIDTSPRQEGQKLLHLVNPRIVRAEGETIYTEGCLSIPGEAEDVDRCGQGLGPGARLLRQGVRGRGRGPARHRASSTRPTTSRAPSSWTTSPA